MRSALGKPFYEHCSELRGENSDWLFSQLGSRSLQPLSKSNSRTGSSVLICLPRIFLAEHYTTDILAGAAIGITVAWLANLPPVRKPLTGWALRWLDANPGAFYAFFLILTYQMVELFDPMLSLLKVGRLIISGRLP